MKTTLDSIAALRLGHSFRSRIEAVRDGSLAVVQTRDVGEDGLMCTEALARVEPDEGFGAERLQPNDVVVTTRGDSMRAALVGDDVGSAILAAPLLRLRVKTESVLPGYLAWYLNHPRTRAALAKSAEGSNVKMIVRSALASLEVDVPPLERQRAIVELARLAAQERRLQDEAAARRQRLLSTVTMRFAEGGAR